MFEDRQGIIIYMNSIKQVRSLRKFGNIHYVSKRMKYVVLYTAMEEVENTIGKISQLSYVKKVEPSYKPFVKTHFENIKSDKDREYDLNYGI